jgi:hypothetical protein
MAALCLLQSGCDPGPGSPTTTTSMQPTSATIPQFSLVPAPNASGEERLRRAILSVHAYVEQHRVRQGRLLSAMSPLVALLPTIPTMPLLQAVQVIKETHDTQEKARVRRMVVRLLAHTRHEAEALDAVKALIGASATAQIVAKVEGSIVAGEPALPQEQLVSQAYALVLGPTPVGTCSDWKAWSDEAMDDDSNDISLTVTADAVPVTFDALRDGLDPQSWGGCSKLWKKTELVTESGGVLTPAPKPLGDAWGDATLHENFVCDDTAPSPPCDIKLLLTVHATEPAADTYRIGYDTPVHFPAAPTDPDDPWVVTDWGWVKATKTTTGAELKSLKIFGFVRKAHTLMVLAWLYAIEEQSYLGDLACCL